MAYQYLEIDQKLDYWTVTINRPERKNSLNSQSLAEFHQVLDEVESSSHCHALVIQGKDGYFCTGMDFTQLTDEITHQQPNTVSGKDYMELLKRFSLFPKFIIAKIEGRTMAGGVGIAAASDLVLATPQSSFALSEAVWGLLPANLMPFLIRRVGFQKAYYMTLTTCDVSASLAHQWHLVDELSDDLDMALSRLLTRLRRVNQQTLSEAKQFFRQMWIVHEEMENTAIQQLDKLMSKPEVTANICEFILHQKFPWEREENK